LIIFLMKGYQFLSNSISQISPTATLYLAFGLTPLSMREIRTVITPLYPSN
jgi:hypothetical protein